MDIHDPLPAAVLQETDDYTLLRRVAAHDSQAFEQFYWRYASRLQGFLTRLLPPQVAAEEVLNEVMLVVWQRAAHFEPRASVLAWLFGIARHKALSARRTVTTLPEPADATLDSATTETPETYILDQERHQTMRQALATLPEVQRQAVDLTYYHGLSYQEIATIVGCPVNTIKTRMLQARRRLARYLQHREDTAAAAPVTSGPWARPGHLILKASNQ